MELTPEERQRIYLEEKARLEIRQHLEAQMIAAPPTVIVQARPSNGVAAVLSLFIPGAGQMYKGSVGVGILWLICTVIGYLMMIVAGLILHLICICHAASMEPSGVEIRNPPPVVAPKSYSGYTNGATVAPKALPAITTTPLETTGSNVGKAAIMGLVIALIFFGIYLALQQGSVNGP